jgi:hypothetical protein
MIITITRVEGPTQFCGKPEQFETFAKAQSRLFTMSLWAPKDGGYDKCDFRITDEATAFMYQGVYDLKHFSVQPPDLRGHCLQNLRFYAGTAKPIHFTPERYAALIDNVTPVQRAEYIKMADWLEAQP